MRSFKAGGHIGLTCLLIQTRHQFAFCDAGGMKLKSGIGEFACGIQKPELGVILSELPHNSNRQRSGSQLIHHLQCCRRMALIDIQLSKQSAQ
ncbi:MAG: hypothetical protein DMG61_01885, partial [Acidobacteria bacterium]